MNKDIKLISDNRIIKYIHKYFTRISNITLSIPVDIYVYDFNDCDKYLFTGIIGIHNNYNRYIMDYLLYDINNEVFLNKDNKSLNISRNDLSYILRYVTKNKKYFIGLSNGNISWNNFISGCKNNKL